MIVDTKEEASTLWKTKAVVIAFILVLMASTAIYLPVAIVFKYIICGVLSVILLLFYWSQYQMEYTYFYFSNTGKNLIFRFYSLRNFHGKPKTIEISRISFLKYDIVTGFFNQKESLVLYQKTPRGVAKYPPISLTLLSKKQKTELKRALFSITNF
jgi:hypothetical protein